MIRAANLEDWQKRYTEGSTGEITKCFFSRVKEAYRILSRVRMTPSLAKTSQDTEDLLSTSPYCACPPDKVQDLLHVLEESPIFLKKNAEIEAGQNLEGELPRLIKRKRK
ncbi:hypothetical protein EVAR_10682_1 [Eumeta japonica]|uniref:Uncharacterized protein n=1 Tax=Eumeta variegata TaxID=151549 RepID=A0A4C1U719_EUMVA|nr:hypothetical protein EVAR_10682_1 [Eumeta japonica]